MNDLDEIHDHNVNVKDRIIYLHQVDQEDSISFKTIPGLIKNLDYLNSINKSNIIVKLLSCDGGCVSNGISAYSSIKNSKAKVTIECYGLTASCATIILQASDNRKISSSSLENFNNIKLLKTFGRMLFFCFGTQSIKLPGPEVVSGKSDHM